MDRHDINAALRRAGSNQAEVARRCGVSRTTVCHVLAGRMYGARVRREIARTLRIPQSDIWRLSTTGKKRRE